MKIIRLGFAFVFGTDLREWILSLNEYQAVALLRSLLIAEASRVGIPVGSVRMTGNVKAKDLGVDGRTDFPPGLTDVVPTGPRTWQVKATTAKPTVSDEIGKSGVQADLNQGRDYVLAWTRDDSPLARTNVEKEIPAEVKEDASQPDR